MMWHGMEENMTQVLGDVELLTKQEIEAMIDVLTTGIANICYVVNPCQRQVELNS